MKKTIVLMFAMLTILLSGCIRVETTPEDVNQVNEFCKPYKGLKTFSINTVFNRSSSYNVICNDGTVAIVDKKGVSNDK